MTLLKSSRHLALRCQQLSPWAGLSADTLGSVSCFLTSSPMPSASSFSLSFPLSAAGAYQWEDHMCSCFSEPSCPAGTVYWVPVLMVSTMAHCWLGAWPRSIVIRLCWSRNFSILSCRVWNWEIIAFSHRLSPWICGLCSALNFAWKQSLVFGDHPFLLMTYQVQSTPSSMYHWQCFPVSSLATGL